MGGLFLLVGVGVILLLTLLTAQVYRTLAPPRCGPMGNDLQSLLVQADHVEFDSTDGLRLRGWLMRGLEGMPPVILCHDLGTDRSSLVNLGLALHAAGFPVLLFDLRGHGESDGARSSLGLKEKRDVLGAVDYLSGPAGPGARRIGIYGVGIGAHAAVLAAADRSALRVLVLDDLYPDASYPLVRGTFADWTFGATRLRSLACAIFAVIHGTRIGKHRAADLLGGLSGRDVLLLAPARDPDVAAEMKRMYEAIPTQPDTDGNLVFVAATQNDGLHGAELAQYQTRVIEFFQSRLRLPAKPAEGS